MSIFRQMNLIKSIGIFGKKFGLGVEAGNKFKNLLKILFGNSDN